MDKNGPEDVQIPEENTNIEKPAEEKEEKPKFLKQEKTDKPYWYVVYTYSGYENKVMDNLLKTVEKKRHVSRKMFPGYVMVKMFLTDESWYVVRNTRGVTGFVGPSSKPIPLSDAEVRSMGIENVRISLDVEVGNNVIVTSGPLESFVGVVEEVNTERQKVRVLVSMFGRDTSVELDFVQVKRI
jgi:transcriptional antiterminator NusG